jgi:alkylation response protein AidB-like acyl-CoA dehydrogenase
MDFAFSAEQKHWHDEAARIGREELAEDVAGRDERREFWREGYLRCGKAGLLALPVPTDFGGRGQAPDTTIAAMEGLGHGCPDNGLIFGVNASLWTITLPILEFGTEAQKRRYLPGLCDGTLFGANAASEPASGSDIFSMTTRADRKGDGWVINGRKIWITGAPVADVFVIFATTDPGRGVMGISCFVLPRDTPGLHVVREIPKMGMRTAPMGEVVFENCELPADALLGREGRGSQIFQFALEWERGGILASTLGTMRRQLEKAVEHARRRKQFGQPIGKFQSVSNRIVDMKMRLETSRFLVHRFAWLKAQGKPATAEASMAKLHVSEAFVQNSLDAVRIFGATGYMVETGLERDLRDSVGGVLFSGTNDIQRNIIASSLKL